MRCKRGGIMSDGCCNATAGALSWVDGEIAGCRLGDKRRVERLRRLLRELGEAIGQPLPLACQDWAGTKAAYRFFDNERISEISGSFQVIEIVTDLLGCKQTPDFTDEGRHLSGEQGIALGGVQEGESFSPIR